MWDVDGNQNLDSEQEIRLQKNGNIVCICTPKWWPNKEWDTQELTTHYVD